MGINVCDVWDYTTGDPNIKIGIYDLIPSNEEIKSNLNSNNPELSKILDTQNLDLSQKESLENILNNI